MGKTIKDALNPEIVKTLEENAAPVNGAGNVKVEPDHKREFIPRRERIPRYKTPNGINEALEHYPAHIVKLVNLVKSNSDIRRYTSLGILNYLQQKGLASKNDKGKVGYVTFNWTKFRVNNNGLSTEYRYTEPFFLNCLIASFTSFANAAQKIIATFCSKEFADFKQDDKDIATAVAAVENADDNDDTIVDES